MNAPLHPPLFTPAQAAALLDQVIYEQVLECVDLDALYHLTQSLAVLVSELEGMPGVRVDELSRTMLDRALLRLPDDIRRYLRTGPFLSFEAPADRCEETRVDRPAPNRPPPSPPRFSS